MATRRAKPLSEGRRRVLRTPVDDVASAACTTSPAATGTTTPSACTSSRPPSSIAGRLAGERLAGGQVDPHVAADRRAGVGVRRAQGRELAALEGVVLRAQAAQQRGEQVRAVGRRPRAASEVASATGSSSARHVDVHADADDRGRARRRVDPLDQDAGHLPVAEQHVVGPLQPTSAARPTQRRADGVPGQQRQPRPAPAARVGPQQHREGQRRRGPASPRCGRAGRGRRSGARRPSPAPRGAPARARSATSALVEAASSTTSTWWSGRRSASRAGRAGSGRMGIDWPSHHEEATTRERKRSPAKAPTSPRTSTSTPPRASWPTSTGASTRRSTPARRRRSRSSTPRAARPPASGSRSSSTRARSSSSTSWPGTARWRSAWRRTGRTATA